MKWGITKRHDQDYGFDSFRNEISRVFDNFFSVGPSTLFENEWLPSLNVDEDEKAILVKAEIPGIKEKDLNVTLQNNILTISGEKKEEKEEKSKDKKTVISERKFGSFSRTITLPESIRADKVNAKFKNGVLTIELPKDETKETKKVKINVK
jgi:HSP20 family protein